MFDIPDNLTNLVSIDGLSRIENSKQFKKYLDKKMKPVNTLLFPHFSSAPIQHFFFFER